MLLLVYQYGLFVRKTKRRIALLILLVISCSTNQALAATITFNTTDETEISVQVSPAEGKALLIWLPSEHGPQASEEKLVEMLSKSGLEVWQVDLFEANFLPISFSSMAKIPASQISALINEAHNRTGKAVFVFSAGRGAIPVLRGARHWQQQHPSGSALAGVILQTPKLYVDTPEPGQEGIFMPIVSATNLPVFIMQPALSPWFWKLPHAVAALEQGGSDVFVQRLPDVRARYYFRPDASRFEQQFSQQLPRLIRQAAWLLSTLTTKTRQPIKQVQQAPTVPLGKKDHTLTVYKGKSTPPALRLQNLQGDVVDLQQLRGEVLLVNFWASWCPPCVHEMPSMSRLANHFKAKPFRILAVNMAETKSTIKHFIETRVKINFPILLDSDGRALRDWRVFAFPTSYVIDRHGRIRYAVFGSIEWDSGEIVHKLEKLTKEE